MCLILFAYDYHPRYKLVVTANRDEFYQRPALPAAFWEDNPEILAGRDLQEGGTWMGVTTKGRFAALTNYREPSSFKKVAPSRGRLVQNYLSTNLTPAAYLETLNDGGTAYNGFNLLLGDHNSLYYYSNREKLVREVEPGIHALSNSLLDVPWPKTTKGVNELSKILQPEEIEVEQLFAIMTDQELPPDKELPETGVGLEMERVLAPAFVVSPEYGTRLTTVILIDHNNKIQFRERNHINSYTGTFFL